MNFKGLLIRSEGYYHHGIRKQNRGKPSDLKLDADLKRYIPDRKVKFVKKSSRDEGIMPDKLIAYCGLYCGACSFKIAFEENDRDHIDSMPAKYEKFRDMPLEFCPGCRLENQCGNCDIKECAEKKKVEYCSLCNEFPCEKLEAFNNDGIPHHSESIENLQLLKQIGPDDWAAMQDEKWKCQCGSKYSWYFKKCKKCSS